MRTTSAVLSLVLTTILITSFLAGTQTLSVKGQPVGSLPILGVWEPETILEDGRSFTVSVNITDVTDLYSYNITLTYDPTILNATTVVFFGTWFNTTTPTVNYANVSSIDNSLGRITANVTLVGEPGGCSTTTCPGNGILVFVTLKVVGYGNTALSIAQTTLADTFKLPIDYTPENGLFRNLPAIGVWAPAYNSRRVFDGTLIPGSNFNVRANITQITDLAAYDVFLKYDANVLQVQAGSLSITGNILEEQLGAGNIIVLAQEEKSGVPACLDCVHVAIFTLGGSATGSGLLFTVNFQVVAENPARLDLLQDTLVNSFSEQISHSTADGFFNNSPRAPPEADFAFTPRLPVQGDIVILDATISLDPDGSILSYRWDLVLGEPPIILNLPILSYVFRNRIGNPLFGTFDVTLTVTDNSGLSDSITKPVRILERQFHDLAVASVTLSPNRVFPGEETALAVKVDNKGTFDENFSITITRKFPDTILLRQENTSIKRGTSVTITLDSGTLGLSPNVYPIIASVDVLATEENPNNNQANGFLAVLERLERASSLASLMGYLLGGGLAAGGLAYVFAARLRRPRQFSPFDLSPKATSVSDALED